MPFTVLLPFLAVAAAQQSGVHLTVLPSASPTITEADDWRCATKDIVGYFEPPTPTGDLYSAHLSYGDAIQTCTLTGAEAFDCPIPGKSLWCGFSSAVPTALSDAYLDYGSTASSWWAARSSAAVSIAQECPQSWWLARDRVSFGANRLNLTIIEAECYAEARVTVDGQPVSTSTMASSGSQPTVPTATASPGASNREDADETTPSQTAAQENAGSKRAGFTLAALLVALLASKSTSILRFHSGGSDDYLVL